MHRSSHIALLALILTFASFPAFAQSGLFRGVVTDSEETPLAGVQVTVTSPELTSYRKTLTTDKDGKFKLRFQKTQTQYSFELQFEKAGYQSFTQPFSPSLLQQMNQEFVMEAAQSAVVETHGDLGSIVTGSSNEAVEAFNAGLAAQRGGDLATARAKLEEALAADSTLAPASVALAQVLLDLGEYGAALGSAEAAIANGGSRAPSLRVQYQALRALGRAEEAEAISVELEQAEDAVATARRLYNEGGEAFQAGDRDTALARFEKAAELDPSLIEAHHAVATLELANGNHEVSAEAAEKALALGSDDIRTLRVLYDAYDALGRTDDLVEIAPRLAKVDPDFGGSKLVEQAAAAWNAGQAERAGKLSRLALAIDPSLAKPHYFLGLQHLSSGQNAEARAALEKFLELAPEDAEAPTVRDMLSYIE